MIKWPGIAKRLKSTSSSQSDGFLVLPARVSGILPKKRPEKKTRTGRSSEISSSLNLEMLEAPENQPLWKNIESLRPSGPLVSQQRYDKIFSTLQQGYKKQQLKEYLKHQSIAANSSATKSKLVSLILGRAWSLEPTDDAAAQSNTKEHTVDLSKRDFLLLIGNNGRLLREWAKSGASIRINPSKYQFIIKCTSFTFDWISASMHHQLDNLVRVEEIDLTQLHILTDFSPLQLEIIQRLTNSYFEFSEDNTKTLFIYSLDKIGITLAKRYLLQLIPCPSTWATSTYYYDVEQTNMPEYHWAENSDPSAIEWYNRSTRWFRWERTKKRNPAPLSPPKFAPLESAEFTETAARTSSEIQQQLAERIQQRGSWAVTATLGYLVHRTDTEYVPNIAQEKIFNTNIPYIRRLAGQLGAYTMDTVQALDDPVDSLEPTEQPDDSSDPWAYLLDKTLVNRPSETAAPVLDHTLRLKFVPDPVAQGSNGYRELPPIELWCPLGTDSSQYVRKGNEISMEDVQAFKLPHEYHDYVSLGSSSCDLRFTSSLTEKLELDANICEYISKCAVNKAGPLFIYPDLEVGGIKYKFRESSFLAVSELNFNGKMLQLVSSDDGHNGGRRIEANLVMDEQDAAEFVKDSFDLVDKLESVRELAGAAIKSN